MSNYITIPQDKHERLKYLRLKHNYTQDFIADKLGVSRSSYNTYEGGIRFVSIDGLKILAQLYNVSTDFILCITDNENPEYISSPDSHIPLNDKSTNMLHNLWHSNFAKFALDTLLSSDDCYRILNALGVLLKIPASISLDAFDCDLELAKCIIHLYQEDTKVNIPSSLMGINEEDSIVFEFQTLHNLLRSHFDLSMGEFINSVCNHQQTQETFVKELIRKYYNEAKSIIED